MINYSNNANKALQIAKEFASTTGGIVGTEHLLYALSCIDGSTSKRMLAKCGIYANDLVCMFAPNPTVMQPKLSKRAGRVLEQAEQVATSLRSSSVGTEHILYTILDEKGSVAVQGVFDALGLDVTALQRALFNMMVEGGGAQPSMSVANGATDSVNDILNGYKSTIYNENDATTATQKSDEKAVDLSKYGTDLTKKARDGKLDPVIGRDKETQRLIEVLCRRIKNNPVLVGEPGVGKSAVIDGLAQAIVKDEVPDLLKGKTVFSLDLTSLVAGTRYRGDFEERLRDTLQAIKQDGNIILFIDEIHTILKAGSSEGGLDIANILKPMLARGELQTIGATTLEEYRKQFEKDSALERRFQQVLVAEPTIADCIEILQGLKSKYEKHHGVEISQEALSAAVILSDRYIADRFLPDKAIDLMDEACSRKKLRSNTVNLVVEEDDIATIVEAQTGIPVKKITEGEGEKLSKLEDSLKGMVIGQDEVCQKVAKAIKRARAGLKDPTKPIGSFIFLGPTGVGKTQLAKSLAKELFGDEKLLIRVDMAEYMTKESVSRLIGAAPGLVGFEEGGQLTEKVRRKPYSVVLFDEIEKGHPDIYNLLLQMLDEGNLTDSHGRATSFKNTVIIITSNIGAKEAAQKQSSLGFGGGQIAQGESERAKQKHLEALKDTIKPEIINRIDEIVVFEKLDKQSVGRIAELLLLALDKRLQEGGIEIGLTKAAKDYIVNCGYDAEYGARPLRRAIQRLVEDKLSEMIIEGKFESGDKIKIDFDNINLTFEKYFG